MEIMTQLIALTGYAWLLYASIASFAYCWTIFRWYFLTKLGFVEDLQKYGKWVVVTGATKGIGKAYAREFAKRGFSIVLISESKSDLKCVSEEMEREFKVQTRTVCFDYRLTTGYERIENELSTLDIGILLNNVGTAIATTAPVSFTEKDPKEMMDVIHCNVFSNICMTHMVVKGMLQRKRGCVIHISSGFIYFHRQYFHVYPATKDFTKKLYKSLRMENKGVIRHQLVTPFSVSTSLYPVKPHFGCPSADNFASSAIRTIGVADITCGYWLHEILRIVFQHVPECVATYIGEQLAQFATTKKL